MSDYPRDDLLPVEPADFVREFQRRAGILVDGIPGPQTWAAFGPPTGCREYVRLVIAPSLGATYLRCTRTGQHAEHGATVRWS